MDKEIEVKYKKLKDLVNYIQPTKYIVNSTQYDDDYKIPVLTAGQTFILGYTNEESGIYLASKENPIILFDDFTTEFKWVDFNFKVKSSATKFLIPKENIEINLRYVFYAMKNINFKVENHSRHWISKFSELEIPVPNLATQNKIVNILDEYNEKCKNLSQKIELEIEKRKEQMEYYQKYIFTTLNNITYKLIDEVCDVIVGGEKPKKCIKGAIPDDKNIYPIYGNGKEIYGFTDTYKIEKDSAVISSIGAKTGEVYYRKGKFTPIVRLKVVVPKSDLISSRYLYYVLKTLTFTSKNGGIPNINSNDIKKMKIPIVDEIQQANLITILDNLADFNDRLNKLLLKELELIDIQSKYYIKSILSFKE